MSDFWKTMTSKPCLRLARVLNSVKRWINEVSVWHWLVFGIVVSLLSVGYWIDHAISNLLATEGATTTATVTEIRSGRKTKRWGKFYFEAKGHRYEDEDDFFGSVDVIEGDKFEVVYWIKDPTLCRIDFKKPVRDSIVNKRFNIEELDSLAMDSILHQWP